ncbi:hypothetical protein SCHPADRAFT_907800 [Schizopora paradoxa]|uniref:Uncharacterized protein n=1 Tax=Schizopora paradoxa TaxID=27342 RepID=A0A0H2RIT7_9AGAM|nr:hypothetical protein SCHPADRAFT_910436 [Schizopora paradoxa]KLO09348.1 hypothetical protein SCHPADRAFT_907800 [Schizopora paradoxa]
MKIYLVGNNHDAVDKSSYSEPSTPSSHHDTTYPKTSSDSDLSSIHPFTKHQARRPGIRETNSLSSLLRNDS